jgi:hypothetical protein
MKEMKEMNEMKEMKEMKGPMVLSCIYYSYLPGTERRR